MKREVCPRKGTCHSFGWVEDPGPLRTTWWDLLKRTTCREACPFNQVIRQDADPRDGVRATRQPLLNLGLPLGFLEAGDAFGFVVVDVEDGIELGNLQKVMNLLGKIQKLQLSALV